MIEAGVGDLVWRIRDDQAQVRYSVVGRSRHQVTPCAICVVHRKKTRSTGFLVWASTGVDSFMIWASKSSRRFFSLGLKTKCEEVCRFTPQNR
jgi:hypothetical protein